DCVCGRRRAHRQARQPRPAGAALEGARDGEAVRNAACGSVFGGTAMTPFELAEPATVKDAVALLDADDPSVRPIAGGTALMLMMKAGVFQPSKLVSLRNVKELTAIGAMPDGALRIGAMTPLATLERSGAVRAHAPATTRTLTTPSNLRVRTVATIGGSLAHADPHMDMPPVLIALGAHVTVAGPAGERTIPVEDLFAGYFET